MAVRGLLVFAGLWLSMQCAGFCFAQETRKELSAEEIVARHEATWAKLEKLAIKAEVKTRTRYCAIGKREDGTTYPIYGFDEKERDHEIYCSGLRQRDTRLGADSYLRNEGLVLRFYQGVEIWNEADFPPSDGHYFGRTIERSGHAHTTLRDWIKASRPKLSRSKNELGHSIYIFKGEFHSKYKYESRPVEEVDRLTIVVNADRGCLIESFQFDCDELSRFKESKWKVSTWAEIEKGIYFPEDFRSDLLCRNEDIYWSQFHLTSIELNPPDLEKQFEYKFIDGMQVTDHTDRLGTFPYAILGPNGEPKQTFVSTKEYTDFLEIQREIERCKERDEWVATLFPDCVVKTNYDVASKTLHTIVQDRSGEIVREFHEEQEIEVCAMVQELIRGAFGNGE